MILTISGLPGSGTSTVARIISERLGVDLVSAGEIFRTMAKENGLTLEEFGELAKSDAEIDKEIDRRQKEIARAARGAGKDVIIEGRISAWMVDPDLAVFVTAPDKVRAERVSHREGLSVADAAEGIKERGACEAERYRKYYNVDVDWLGVYDLVVNSGRWDQGGVSEIVLAAIDAALSCNCQSDA